MTDPTPKVIEHVEASQLILSFPTIGSAIAFQKWFDDTQTDFYKWYRDWYVDFETEDE